MARAVHRSVRRTGGHRRGPTPSNWCGFCGEIQWRHFPFCLRCWPLIGPRRFHLHGDLDDQGDGTGGRSSESGPGRKNRKRRRKMQMRHRCRPSGPSNFSILASSGPHLYFVCECPLVLLSGAFVCSRRWLREFRDLFAVTCSSKLNFPRGQLLIS